MSEDIHVTNNFRVLASLTDIFRQLAEHHALVGRLDSMIVIDANKAPPLFLDEFESVFPAFRLTSECGAMCVFSSFQSRSDDETETIMLDADTVLRRDLQEFVEFPALYEIRKLIEIIPPLPQELTEHYAAISEDVSASIRELMRKHHDEIMSAVFSGSDDEAIEVRARTIN